MLPNVSADASQHTVAMHIFAMGVSSPSATTVVSLKAHANGDYVTADNAAPRH